MNIGLICTPDPLHGCTGQIEKITEKLNSYGTLFEAPICLTDLPSAAEARKYFVEKEVAVVLVMCCTLSGDGDLMFPLCDAAPWEIAVWSPAYKEPEGFLINNSLTCANLYMSTAKIQFPDRYVKWLYGNVDSPFMEERLSVFLNALKVKAVLKNAVIARIGGTAEGFINLAYDPCRIRSIYGSRIVDYEISDLLVRMEQADEQKAKSLALEMKESSSDCSVSEQQLVKTAKLVLAVEAMRDELGISAFAISCWPKFQIEAGLSTCTAFGMLNERGTVVSCEGDVPGAMTMLALKTASGYPAMIMDMTTGSEEADAITFWHCGVGLPGYADSCGFRLDKYPQDPAIMDEPGVSTDMKFASGHVTICRMNGTAANEILVCQSDIVEGPDRSYRGARGWFGNFTMDSEKISFADIFNTIFLSGNAHHYIIVKGNAEDVIRQLGKIMDLDIIPLIKHKVYE